MKKAQKTRIGEEFRPAPQFRSLYFIYFIAIIIIGILSWYIPVFLFAPFIVTLIISVPLLVIIVFTAWWIPKYYGSVFYRLTGDEMVWRRGVWFKNTGIVPYNRITNIDISQGPISRSLRIAALKIQTAGYSGQQARSEIRIEGVEHFEDLREMIMGFVRGRRPVSVETYQEGGIEARMLSELVKIRELLKRKR